MTALSLQLWTSKSPDALTPERFNKPQNDITRAAVHKPRGGLWTSTYDPMEGSAWLRWCKDQGFEAPPWHGFLIKPDPSAVIYMIDSVPDIELLFERYGYQPFIDLSQELITHQRLTQSLDFEKISRDFDAIHITERGHEATRFGFLEYPGWFRMFDWSCESTLWLRWSFESVEYIGRHDFEPTDHAGTGFDLRRLRHYLKNSP